MNNNIEAVTPCRTRVAASISHNKLMKPHGAEPMWGENISENIRQLDQCLTGLGIEVDSQRIGVMQRNGGDDRAASNYQEPKKGEKVSSALGNGEISLCEG